MKLFRAFLALIVACALLPFTPALAAAPVYNLDSPPPPGAAIQYCVDTTTPGPPYYAYPCDSTHPMQIAGTFSATLAGFTPNGSVANLTAGVASGNVALPTGSVVKVTNGGTVVVHYKLSVGAGSAATTDDVILPGAAVGLTVGSNTFINAITETSTTAKLSLSGGAGLVSGFGGGGSGGGGGGGGAVTVADGADTAEGATTDTAGCSSTATVSGCLKQIDADTKVNPTGAATSANQATGNTSLSTIATNTTGASLATNQTAIQASAGSDASKAVSIQGITGGKNIPVSQPTASNLNATVVGTGTFATQSAQSGTWTVQPGNTPNTTAWKVDGSAATQPVSAAALPLPSGAATAAKQPALGTAGSPSTDVITVQYPSSGGTAVPVTSGVAQASTTSGQTVSPVGCRTLTSAPTDTTAQTNIPWCRTNGAQANDIASINGTTVLAGTGAQGAGAQRVTVATDTATIAGSAPGTAGTPSANVVTVQGAASMTPVLSQSVPGTANGLSFATITAANSTNATNLKSTAGQLYHITGYSAAAVPTWVSFYNTSGAPTCGTGIVYQMLIPVNATSGGGAVDDIPSGLAFSSGIGYCMTTGIAGTGSVAATSIVLNLGYK